MGRNGSEHVLRADAIAFLVEQDFRDDQLSLDAGDAAGALPVRYRSKPVERNLRCRSLDKVFSGKGHSLCQDVSQRVLEGSNESIPKCWRARKTPLLQDVE